jgi:hypothetical protein
MAAGDGGRVRFRRCEPWGSRFGSDSEMMKLPAPILARSDKRFRATQMFRLSELALPGFIVDNIASEGDRFGLG